MIKAAKKLKELGARKIIAFATHGIFSGDFYAHLYKCEAIDKLYVSDSLPSRKPDLEKKLQIERISLKNIISEFCLKIRGN